MCRKKKLYKIQFDKLLKHFVILNLNNMFLDLCL